MTAVIVYVTSLPQQVGAYTQRTELAMVRWPLTHLRGDQDISAADIPGWIETVSTTALISSVVLSIALYLVVIRIARRTRMTGIRPNYYDEDLEAQFGTAVFWPARNRFPRPVDDA